MVLILHLVFEDIFQNFVRDPTPRPKTKSLVTLFSR